VSRSMPGGNLKTALGDARTRMRDRFRKREE
jgi:hypothetical protein